MWNSIKVQLKTMRVSREFRVAMIVTWIYAVVAFVLRTLEVRGIDIFRVEDANQYVCFSPYHPLFNIFKLIYPFIIVMPFATSYIDDYKNQLIMVYASRVSRVKYFISKLIVAYIGTALIVAIPFLLNLALCNIFFPHNMNVLYGSYQMKNYYNTLLGLNFMYEPTSNNLPFLELYLQNPISYNLLYIALFSLLTGLLGMFAMACAFVIKKSKILVYVPIYVIVQVAQSVDMAFFNAALDEGEKYIAINPIDYFLPLNNGGGFSIAIILTEICLISIGIFLMSNYAINDDIRSLQ